MSRTRDVLAQEVLATAAIEGEKPDRRGLCTHQPGDGGFPGGLNADKYMKMTGVSKATATRDLAGMVAAQLLWTTGQGKGMRYYVNVPGWTHGV